MKLGISVRFFLFYTDIFPVIIILPLCQPNYPFLSSRPFLFVISTVPLCHSDRSGGISAWSFGLE